MCHHVFQMLLFPVVTLIPFMWFLFVHLIMVYGPYNYFDFISQISNNGWNDRSKKNIWENYCLLRAQQSESFASWKI